MTTPTAENVAEAQRLADELCGKALTTEEIVQIIAEVFAAHDDAAKAETWQTIDTAPKDGDYVLATKYLDGDPGDAWAVGYYDGNFDHYGTIRHLVKDDKGCNLRNSGFRRLL